MHGHVAYHVTEVLEKNHMRHCRLFSSDERLSSVMHGRRNVLQCT